MIDDEVNAKIDIFGDDEIEITLKDGTKLRGSGGTVTDGVVKLGKGKCKSTDIHSIKRIRRKIETAQGQGWSGSGNNDPGSGPERS